MIAWPIGDIQIVVAAETHGRYHVGNTDATRDQAWPPVDGTVPHGTGGVLFGMVRRDPLALEPFDFHGRRLCA